MKIQELTPEDIEQVAEGLKSQLRTLADQKHEEALILELNASNKTDKEKLRDYLSRTRLRPQLVRNVVRDKGVKNQYIEEQLRIHRHKLCQVRDELMGEGVLTAFWDLDGILRILPRAWE